MNEVCPVCRDFLYEVNQVFLSDFGSISEINWVTLSEATDILSAMFKTEVFRHVLDVKRGTGFTSHVTSTP